TVSRMARRSVSAAWFERLDAFHVRNAPVRLTSPMRMAVTGLKRLARSGVESRRKRRRGGGAGGGGGVGGRRPPGGGGGTGRAGRGVKRGARAGWCAYNAPEVVCFTPAARKLGLVSVPLNYRFTAPEMSYVVEDSGARLAMAGPDVAELVSKVCAGIPAAEAV